MKEVKALYDRVAQLEHIVHQHARHGIVAERDAEKHRIRLEFQEKDGKKFLSPWIPYSQIAGTRKVHTVPSIGQTMTLYSPSGDWQQSVAVPFIWSKKNPSPSTNGDEDIDLRGKTRRTQKDADLKQEIDGVTRQYTKQSVKVTIHKDPETEQEGQGETVDDAHPWKGNRAKTKHTRTINKDAGYNLTVNEDDADNKHKQLLHPENGHELSFKNGKHKIVVNQSEIKSSYDDDKLHVKLSGGKVETKAESEIKDTAQKITHNGATDIIGNLDVQGMANISQTLSAALGQFGGFGAIGGGALSGGGGASSGIGPGAMQHAPANKILAGPASGADGPMSYRALTGDDLPNPGATTKGGVKSAAAPSNQFMTGIDANGAPTFGQPSFSNVSGSVSSSQLSGLNSLGDYADDAAAATGGVSVGGLYRTGSALKVRVA